jgi:hypothetical protein
MIWLMLLKSMREFKHLLEECNPNHAAGRKASLRSVLINCAGLALRQIMPIQDWPDSVVRIHHRDAFHLFTVIDNYYMSIGIINLIYRGAGCNLTNILVKTGKGSLIC